MTEVQEKKLRRLKALAFEWARDPRFKEMCRRTWDPVFFMECEKTINELNKVWHIEYKHNHKDWSVKYLDISEINVEGW